MLYSHDSDDAGECRKGNAGGDMEVWERPSYEVVEIFQSINGEGQRAGERAAFVRMKGCNLVRMAHTMMGIC